MRHDAKHANRRQRFAGGVERDAAAESSAMLDILRWLVVPDLLH